MSSASTSGRGPANSVPERAQQWIQGYLRSVDAAATSRAVHLATHGLDVLQVKDLKKLCIRLNDLIVAAQSQGSSHTYRFVKPRSGACKADLIAALRRPFHANSSCTVPAPSHDAIWTLVRSTGGSSSGTAAAAGASAGSRGSAAAGTGTGGGSRLTSSSSGAAAAASSRSMPLPTVRPPPHASAAYSGIGGTGAYEYSVGVVPPYMAGFQGFGYGSGPGWGTSMPGASAASAAFGGMPLPPSRPAAPVAARKPSPAPKRGKKRPAPQPVAATQPPMEPDYVDMTLPPSQWGPPRTNGALARAVKIKQEKHAAATASRPSSTAGSSAAAVSSSAASSIHGGDDGEDYYDSHPRDGRESSLVGQMRSMGFTDVREILHGLRHVEDEKKKAATATGQPWIPMMMLDVQTHLEEAMMWIVAQREEADEARKMDLVRINSEFDNSEEERKRRAEQRLEEAPLEDIVGVDDDADDRHGDHRPHRSKYFHFSTILKSEIVRGVFLSLSNDEKSDLVRLLKLEQKANQWYGSVLPWAYFTYKLKGRIESWAEDGANSKPSADADDGASSIGDLIRSEANALERALFSLSEQQNNGLQNVPKCFMKAREDALKKGLPDGPEGQATGDKSGDSDDDVIVVLKQSPSGGAAKKCQSSSSDRKLPASSPRRNCSSTSTSTKKTPSTEVIEIM